MNSVEHDHVVAQLSSLGVPSDLIAGTVVCLPPTLAGLLLYGSRARGDHQTGSDLDLLALVPGELGSRSVGRVNLSCYTPGQLASASGTLFGEHLQRDGLFVFDPLSHLSSIVSAFESLDVDRIFDRVRRFAPLLKSVDSEANLVGCVRLGKYLLRSAIYADAIRDGHPCFSVRELAERYVEPRFVELLDSNSQTPTNVEVLEEIVSRLTALTGAFGRNPFGTLAELIEAERDVDRERCTLAIMITRHDQQHEQSPFDYSLLPKVLL